MPSLSVNASNDILNAWLAGAALVAPASVDVCLAMTAPVAAGDGSFVEPSSAQYAGYARQTLTCNATNFPAAVSGTITNGTAINFPTSGGGISSPAVPTFVVLVDHSTGRMVAVAALPPNTIIGAGQPLLLTAGSLTFTLGPLN